MKFNELLEEYMHGQIDANKLYNCVRKEFMVLFENYKFRELEYLKKYPFLYELQDEDLYCEAILNDRVREIYNVLNGKQAFIYDMWIKLLSLMVGLPTIMVFIRTIYYM